MVIAIKATALIGAYSSLDLMTIITSNERICEAISQFLTKGISDYSDVTNTLFLLGAKRLIQELLEQEQEAKGYFGREHYECNEEKKGLRNGYKERQLKSAEGLIPVFLPQLRGTEEETCSSRLWSFVGSNSDVFRYLVAEMYARGLSTRDIEAIETKARPARVSFRSLTSRKKKQTTRLKSQPLK